MFSVFPEEQTDDMKNMKRILEVSVNIKPDDDGDTSWLGTYSNEWKPYSIDRSHDVDCAIQTKGRADEVQSGEDEDVIGCTCGSGGFLSRRVFRYFNPSFNYVDDNGKLVDGVTSEEVIRYVKQDYERMEGLNAGAWSFVGIVAEAKLQITQDAPLQTITSAGLWGIESDSGDDYFNSVADDELAQLKTELKGLGFGARAVSTAFKDVRKAWE